MRECVDHGEQRHGEHGSNAADRGQGCHLGERDRDAGRVWVGAEAGQHRGVAELVERRRAGKTGRDHHA